jgi:hypothetical protein
MRETPMAKKKPKKESDINREVSEALRREAEERDKFNTEVYKEYGGENESKKSS